jgi:hypothetical protein
VLYTLRKEKQNFGWETTSPLQRDYRTIGALVHCQEHRQLHRCEPSTAPCLSISLKSLVIFLVICCTQLSRSKFSTQSFEIGNTSLTWFDANNRIWEVLENHRFSHTQIEWNVVSLHHWIYPLYLGSLQNFTRWGAKRADRDIWNNVALRNQRYWPPSQTKNPSSLLYDFIPLGLRYRLGWYVNHNE